MARHLFIAQQTLTNWVDQEKIDFDGDVMTIRADRRQFRLVEAVRFIRVEGDDADKAGLVGKVKTNDQLKCLGAERCRDSVICNDVAYLVQEGFLGEIFLKAMDDAVCDPVASPAPVAANPRASAKAPASTPPPVVLSSPSTSARVRPLGAAPAPTEAPSRPALSSPASPLGGPGPSPLGGAGQPPREPGPASSPASPAPVSILPAAPPRSPGAFSTARTQVVRNLGQAPVQKERVEKSEGEKKEKKEGEPTDEDLLTRFLLDNL